MTPDLFTRFNVNWAIVYPPLMIMYRQAILACAAQGRDYYATCGTRTWDEQTTLYLQGRQSPGQIVTNARAGSSAHNYGIAIDSTFDKDAKMPGLQPSWLVSDYEAMAISGRKYSLDAGYFWPMVDGPHMQLNLAAKGLTLAVLRAKYLERRSIPDVWDLLNRHGPWGVA